MTHEATFPDTQLNLLCRPAELIIPRSRIARTTRPGKSRGPQGLKSEASLAGRGGRGTVRPEIGSPGIIIPW